MKTLLTIVLSLLVISCTESKENRPKPFISMGSNNNSETSIEIEEIILDGKWHGIATGFQECGTSINGGGGGGPLWETPLPMDTIYVKWYSWSERKNIEATVQLPPKDILKRLYYHPPWFEPDKQHRPESEIIVDIRPNKKVWVKLSKDSYPASQEDIMIIGEATGTITEEVVTKYRYFKEGKDYRLDCEEKRKKLKEMGAYTGPTKVLDKWYPGAPQNKESSQ